MPYNNLPLLPPDTLPIITVDMLSKLVEARAALAELKGRIPVIPDPLMLINTLVLQEARDSFRIENIETNYDILFKGFSASRMKLDNNTKEVLRYRDALWNAYNKIESSVDIDKNLIIEIFKTITEFDEELRSIQVYIGSNYYRIYTPPEPKTLHDKLNNWFDFAKKNKTFDPLIKMAILHYQFESIHPFRDGNDRAGRILNILYNDIYSHELVELIFSQTDCTIGMLVNRNIASRNTASKYLNRLEDMDILRME